MGEIRPKYVSKMSFSGDRLDADVVLGSTKVHVTVTGRDEGVAPELQALLGKVINKAQADLAEHLEEDLSASTRRSLTS